MLLDFMDIDFLGTEWQEYAACRDADPRIFDPDVGRFEKKKTDWAQARQICDGCPVKLVCREAALAEKPANHTGQKHQYPMFAGGRSPDELVELWLERQEKAAS